MTNPRPLGKLWTQLSDRLGQLGVPVFPAVPTPAANNFPVVDWPGADWAAFLDFATRVGVPVVYAAPERVTADLLEELVDAADAIEADVVANPDEDRAVLVEASVVRRWRAAAAASEAGAIGRVSVGFVVNGVLHQWTESTDEHDDFFEALIEAYDAMSERRENSAEHEVNVAHGFDPWRVDGDKLLVGLKTRAEEWAQLLLASQAYTSGANRSARRVAACGIVPELGRWFDADHQASPELYAQYWTARNACDLADKLWPAMRDRLLAGLRARANDFAATVAFDDGFPATLTKEVRKQFVREQVTSELGFPSRQLTDLILDLTDALRPKKTRSRPLSSTPSIVQQFAPEGGI